MLQRKRQEIPLATWRHLSSKYGTHADSVHTCYRTLACRACSPRFHTPFVNNHPALQMMQIASFLTIVCCTCSAAFAALAAASALGSAELTAVVMYFFAALLLVAPLNIFAMSGRQFFGKTLQRVLLPFQEVSWADFLLADIMTSLSKSSGDLAKMVDIVITGKCRRVYSGQTPSPQAWADTAVSF